MVSWPASKKLLCALSLLCLLSGCGREAALPAAETAEPTATAMPTAEPLPQLAYPELAASLGGEGLSQVYAVDGAVFLPMHSICDVLGFALRFEGDAAALEAELDGLELIAQAGQDYLCASGRYLYIPEGWIVQDGGLWLPLDAVCRLLGLNYNNVDGCIELDSAAAKVMLAGEDYYDTHFDMELVYWLPQIINAEAKGQPLEGMIGVGNVVMNRMESELFPSRITSVLYEREYAIQFEPVQNGSIKAQPDEMAYIAAWLCLEGYNTVEDCLYFVNPAYGSAWFDRDLELYKAIGEHNFYKLKD